MRGLLLCLVALAVAGCGGGGSVNWDVSQGHGTSSVGMQATGDHVHQIDQVDATIKLPGSRTLHASNVTVVAHGVDGQVQSIDVKYPKTTLDAGYEQARAFAKQWGLRTDNLDAWRQQVLAGRSQGVKDSDEPFPVTLQGPDLAPGGPTLDAEVIYSFDEAQPFMLDVSITWPPDGS